MSGKRSKQAAEEDTKSRIRKLKKKVEALTGEPMVSAGRRNLPLEIEEQFWEQVLEFEQARPVSPFEMLVKGGAALTPPNQLDDAQLSAKLWELIHAMALLGIFLHSTNHVTDRELYEHLWKDSLREPTFLQPSNPDYACHIDLVSSGSEEDNFLYMKYYADEEVRRCWRRDFPEYVMPEHTDPPFDRDRHLPNAESFRRALSSSASNATARRRSPRSSSKRPC
jgi:hypothetical protein